MTNFGANKMGPIAYGSFNVPASKSITISKL
jgi:hypothetical protein